MTWEDLRKSAVACVHFVVADQLPTETPPQAIAVYRAVLHGVGKRPQLQALQLAPLVT